MINIKTINLMTGAALQVIQKHLSIIGVVLLCNGLLACEGSTTTDTTNTPPQITSAVSASIPENTLSAHAITATDDDGDTLSYSVSGGADQALFSIVSSTGALSFISSPDFEMPADSDGLNDYVVEVSVSDGESSDSQQVTITVTDVDDSINTPPQITSAASVSIPENTLSALAITATDDDGDTLSYSLSGGVDQALFGIVSSTGALSFISSPDFEVPTDSDGLNDYVVEVSVSDGVSSDSQQITITVTDVSDNANTPPQFTSSAAPTVQENITAVFTVTADDADGNTLSFGINGGADQALFSINASSGALRFITAADFEIPADSDANNSYLVQVSANDGVSTVSQLITVSVTNVNDNSPQINSLDTASVDENTTSVITVSASDADNDTITYGINGGADQALFSINPSSGALGFNAAPNFEIPTDSNVDNSYEVRVSANDGVSTVSQVMIITVINVNDISPQINSLNTASMDENTTSVITVSASDADNDTITYSIIGGLDQLLFSINATSGALVFNAPPDFETPADNGQDNGYEVQVRASDGVNSADQIINITVNDVAIEQVVGLPSRPANPNCAITDAPVLAAPIQLTQVFTSLVPAFSKPVVLLQSPVDTNRWYVGEQSSGLIKTFLSSDSATSTFANLSGLISTAANEMGLLGVAFHPDYANNGYVFIYYSAPKTSGGAEVHHQSVIVRYTATNDTTLNMSSGLEILRIDQPAGNHNGGNIAFGADGFLYIGMGDGGGSNDQYNNSQDITSYLGKMLRINIDQTNGAINYTSPADNPYVGITGLDEIYASGLRNPWRWSFDKLNNDLILGDVGQSAREEIDFITNGGNYGWPCFEGSLSGSNSTTSCTQQSDYDAPLYEYPRGDGKSVTGGFIYRGSAIPDLYGTYIYSDYFPSPIWGIADPGGTNQANSTLLSGGVIASTYVSTFAEDADGELYITSFLNGRVYRLDPGSDVTGNFPTQLSATGCIDSISPLQMASGLVPYEINAPFWSDGAVKTRWMALPDGSTITIEADGDWTFPINSVLVKNFNLNGTRVETRLLVRHADGNWGGYSYEWNAGQTDANLLLNGKITTKEGQTYIYPSGAECFQCHTTTTNIVLGPETRQINRDHTYLSTGITANQLLTLESIGYFSTALADIPANLPRLTDPSDVMASDHDRARAYLYTNCSQCHRAGGPTNVNLDFNITTADAGMNACETAPTYAIGGATAILSTGNSNSNAANSSMYLRMTCREGVGSCVAVDQMPPLGSVLVDPQTQVVGNWINSLSACP